MKNLWMLLALSLFSGHALADGTMGNGSGWCQPTSGTHDFPFSFNQTITDTDGNQTGTIVEEHWSAGGEYSAKCDCDNSDYRGYNYFTATTGDLTQKGTHSETRYYGHMDYYVLVAGKLEIGTEAYIAGKLGEYIPVPFSSISNNDASAGGCGDAEMKSMTAGNKGTVRIYTYSSFGRRNLDPANNDHESLFIQKRRAAVEINIPPLRSPCRARHHVRDHYRAAVLFHQRRAGYRGQAAGY